MTGKNSAQLSLPKKITLPTYLTTFSPRQTPKHLNTQNATRTLPTAVLHNRQHTTREVMQHQYDKSMPVPRQSTCLLPHATTQHKHDASLPITTPQHLCIANPNTLPSLFPPACLQQIKASTVPRHNTPRIYCHLSDRRANNRVNTKPLALFLLNPKREHNAAQREEGAYSQLLVHTRTFMTQLPEYSY